MADKRAWLLIWNGEKNGKVEQVHCAKVSHTVPARCLPETAVEALDMDSAREFFDIWRLGNSPDFVTPSTITKSRVVFSDILPENEPCICFGGASSTEFVFTLPTFTDDVTLLDYYRTHIVGNAALASTVSNYLGKAEGKKYRLHIVAQRGCERSKQLVLLLVGNIALVEGGANRPPPLVEVKMM